MGVQQSIAVPKGKGAGLAYLRRLVEYAKASGLGARAPHPALSLTGRGGALTPA